MKRYQEIKQTVKSTTLFKKPSWHLDFQVSTAPIQSALCSSGLRSLRLRLCVHLHRPIRISARKGRRCLRFACKKTRHILPGRSSRLRDRRPGASLELNFLTICWIYSPPDLGAPYSALTSTTSCGWLAVPSKKNIVFARGQGAKCAQETRSGNIGYADTAQEAGL